jgi:peroxiredoxin
MIRRFFPRAAVAAARCGLFLGALLCAGCSPGKGADHAGSEHALVGVGAPTLELPSADQKATVKLADHRGKVVLLDFWATWCEPCRKSFPAYQKLMDRSAGRLVVIGVSVDEDPSGIAQFVEETRVSFPIAWDEGQAAAQSYAPPTMPTSFVVDKNGIVRSVHAGYEAGDELALEQELQSLY